jgi:uncharacterized protein YjbJ (UPF0337 family)
MLQLNPTDKLPIIRQLNNPNDNTGYYVRAVVRNSLLQTVLKTIALVDVGGGRFESSYLVPPADGTYFDITTKVYSDAGYTTQDTQYADENNQYLGALRWGLQYWNAGNGGTDIDYKKIRKIVEEEVGKITTLSQEEVSGIVSKATNEIQKAIESTHKAVTDIVIPEVKIPEQKETDLSPVISAIEGIKPLITEIKEQGDEINDKGDNLMTAIGGLADDNQAMLMTVIKKQDEKGESEMQLAKERDLYKEQLTKIRKSVGDIESEYPEMKPDMEDDNLMKQEEEQRQKEQELRVKNYIK